jgi:hypothetical protein
MRLPHNDGGLARVVIVLSVLCVMPAFIGLGIWLTAPNGTDAPPLFGILGSLAAPSCFLLLGALASFISRLLGD